MSRRRFLLGTGGVAAGLVLSACSSAPVAVQSPRIGPGSPRVTAVEASRGTPGQRTVEASLQATPSRIDLGERVVDTWSFSGELPGQEIRVRRGDLLRVELRNGLPQPTTVHWHGIALRNDMDGVPVLTQPAVAPGAGFRYEFTAPNAGTYWFHPHVGVQLDRGLYAPLIVEDPAEPGNYDSELVVVLDDWLDGTGRTPDAVLADLQANGMGGMGMGHGGGPPGPGGGMAMARSALLRGDAGDVSYPYYLANGRTAGAPRSVPVRPGQRVRLRMINAGGDTAFRVGIPGVPMTVTHTDGYPVVPVQAQAVLLGMGERIDAVVRVPAATVPLVALAEGKGGQARILLASGGAVPDAAAPTAALAASPVLMATDLRAADAVMLAERRPDVQHDLVLGGPEAGYRWTINGQPYDPNRGLPVRQGQRVRLRMTNKTTMFHPMHLHGHTFQVRAAQGPGPRKDTLVVLPAQTLDVDFDADNPGQWLTHCHNIYHGEAGMMTVVSYVE